ncbi:hypothetical protein LZ198_39375 [Myxococcus sp. K15C18031901]|uniref:hypothetical protein n=1 Tax=Myxococcus dinghuensis TaxID=2906761 RepID=UPI0020A7FDF0|nr:hypothetical protein [Myxococcus dinghuensis]MCP3104945.1 hypothetical protein [Myxococcus dinghuensis]
MSSRWWFASLPLLCSTPVLAQDGVTVNVRCTEKCTVLLEGKRGNRVDDATWAFKGVRPGKRRLEASGVLGRPLVSSFADIPDAAVATVYLASNKRIVVETGSTPMPGTPTWAKGTSASPEREAPGAPSTAKTGTSLIHVRCPEPCTLSMDGARKGSTGTTGVSIEDVAPGARTLEASFMHGSRVRRSTLDIPEHSEVFVTVTEEKGFQVTNTKALAAK